MRKRLLDLRLSGASLFSRWSRKNRRRFRPHNRMKSGAQFSRAYRRGSRAKGSILQVVVFEHGGAHTRLGLSVGKRIWRSAVKRNKVRRVFREAFRLEYEALPKGCDLVLIPAAGENE